MKSYFWFLTILFVCFMFVVPSAVQAEPMKNVIVMISDGCGDNQIQATDMYWGSNQDYENFPVRLHMCNYSWTTLQGDPVGYNTSLAWTDFNYMLLRPTDSASAATAMSTGVKNRDNEINVDPIDRHRLFTVTERAKQLGKSAGVITTVEWSHATPAGFAAHNVNRNNYSQIAIEMLDSCNLDVIMGAGHPLYDDNNTLRSTPNYSFVGGQTKWNQLVNGTTTLGWTLIQDRSEFQSIMSGPTPDRLCGTFKCATTSQQARTPLEGYNTPVAPYTIPMNNVPTLAEMSRGALNVLDNNPSGFFLMIEGGAIDWACHANQHGRLIEEETDFNNAVSAVIDWVEANSNWNETMLIVTGDHETGYLWGINSGVPSTFNSLISNGVGQLPSMWYYGTNHSNQLIPFFAKGEGSQYFSQFSTRNDPVRGAYIDNTDVARVVFGYYDHILAVELSSFEAISSDDRVNLNWATASETDNEKFEIFRDGSLVAAIASQGNSSNSQYYSWTDYQVLQGKTYAFSLSAVDVNGQRKELGSRTVTVNGINSAEVSRFALYQVYPNPFNPTAQIAFDLPMSCDVTLEVYNPIGQKVSTLLNGNQSSGRYTVTFDASNMTSGLYFCKLSAQGFESIQKMVLMK